MDKISESQFKPIQPNEFKSESHDETTESKWLLTASEHGSLSTIPPTPSVIDSEENSIDDEIVYYFNDYNYFRTNTMKNPLLILLLIFNLLSLWVQVKIFAI